MDFWQLSCIKMDLKMQKNKNNLNSFKFNCTQLCQSTVMRFYAKEMKSGDIFVPKFTLCPDSDNCWYNTTVLGFLIHPVFHKKQFLTMTTSSEKNTKL